MWEEKRKKDVATPSRHQGRGRGEVNVTVHEEKRKKKTINKKKNTSYYLK